MTLKTKTARKKLLKSIKCVITNPPQLIMSVFRTEDYLFTITKSTDSKIHIVQYASDLPKKYWFVKNFPPRATVELTGDLPRDLCIIEFKLLFLSQYHAYDEKMFALIFDFLNDDKQTVLEDTISGLIYLRKRDNKYVDVGYFDTLSDAVRKKIQPTVTTTVPISQNKRETAEAISGEIEKALFYTFNPKTGDFTI